MMMVKLCSISHFCTLHHLNINEGQDVHLHAVLGVLAEQAV